MNGLIEAQGLSKEFPTPKSLQDWLTGKRPVLTAVNGIDLTIQSGESVGLLGESGCGKTTTGRMLLNLVPPSSGRVLFDGQDVRAMDAKSTRTFRRNAQLVFQNPYDALNPRFTLYRSLMEPLVNCRVDLNEHESRLQRALKRAQLMQLEHLDDTYPHEISGGQLQRVALARALILEPRFLVADEPVSMLDVSVRAGILNVLRDVGGELGLSALYISHDLALVRYLCTRTIVMYLGRFVEDAPTEELIQRPLHPYTQALIKAVPSLRVNQSREPLPIMGAIPDAPASPIGCGFKDRCPYAMPRCATESPNFRDVGHGRKVACHLI